MIYLYFSAVYGIPLAMMWYAWLADPKRKKNTTNTGLRL